MQKRVSIAKIEDFVKKSYQGTLINDIASAFKISRNSVVIELARLEGAGKVSFRKLGNVKLYFYTGDKK